MDFTHPNIEESKTIVACVLRIEVLHAHFVHPRIVGLPKLKSRGVSKYMMTMMTMMMTMMTIVGLPKLESRGVSRVQTGAEVQLN